MKKLFLFTTLVLGTCFGTLVSAQVSVSFNIGVQPVWGPTGYDEAEYYYIPDAGAYYDINRRVFVYQQGGRWVNGAELPGQYRNIDLYHTHKVVINERTPWMHNDRYRGQYAQYRGRHDQMAIRDSHEERYFQNPGHPQHNAWMQQHGNGGGDHHDNGNHGGDYHGNGGGDHHENGNHGGEDHGHGGDDHRDGGQR